MHIHQPSAIHCLLFKNFKHLIFKKQNIAWLNNLNLTCDQHVVCMGKINPYMSTFIYLNLYVLVLQWAKMSQNDGIVTQACEEMCYFFESSPAKTWKMCRQAILLGLCLISMCENTNMVWNASLPAHWLCFEQTLFVFPHRTWAYKQLNAFSFDHPN